MGKRVWLISVLICFAVMDVAAQAVSYRDTVGGVTHYTPIDYSALMRELERASRPTLWQRLTGAASQRKSNAQERKITLTGNVGVGYTQLTNAMFTATGTAQYRLQPELPQSFTSLSAMVSVNGFYRLHAAGEAHLSQSDKIEYSIGGGEMPVRFWGLGYEAADNNSRTKYTRGGVDFSLGYVRHIVAGLSLGAGVDFRYATAGELEPMAEDYLQQAGLKAGSAHTTGINLMVKYDGKIQTEDVVSGYYLCLAGGFHPKALGSHSTNIWHIEAVANYYQPLWSGAVAALDLYADMWSWNTPWLFWAKVGGENRMRGYYYGRYTDRKMATAQLELRQRIYGPIGCVVWGGVGSVFSSHKLFDVDRLLPNYGVGVRFAAGGRTSLRIDYGFGRHSNGLVINVNEAF